ncbi:MAG: helix-turn-helix transcriptional regulator, partial [Methanomicrobia archaeon]|nr:helix-turn-helix transcriptional regulator [Methanomicrobia archaeon]
MNNENIKRLRTDLGLSQREFAEKIGTSQKTVWFWESGKSQPSSEFQDNLTTLQDEYVVNVVKNGSQGSQNLEIGSQKDVVKVVKDVVKVVKDVVKSSQEVVKEGSQNTEQVVKNDGDVVKDGSQILTTGSQDVVKNQEVVSRNDTNVSSEGSQPASPKPWAIGNEKVASEQVYYETMYEGAHGYISLCAVTQLKGGSEKDTLKVKGFYEISQMSNLLAEANKQNGQVHIYTGIHPLKERPKSGRG